MPRSRARSRSEAGTGKELVPSARGSGVEPVAPWDLRSDEPASAYAAFIVYRNLAPGGRFIQKLIDLEREHRATGAGERYPLSDEGLRALSETYDWANRAAAWDAANQLAIDLQAVALARSTSLDQVKQAATMLNEAGQFFEELRSRLAQGALKKLPAKELFALMPGMVRMNEAAVRSLRLQGGQSTENVAVAGQVVVTSGGQTFDVSQLQTDELRQARAALQRAAHPPEPVIEGEVVETDSD